MKKMTLMVLFFTILILLNGCVEKNDNLVKDNDGEIIKIGMIAPLGSVASTYGEDAVNVKKEAIEHFNKTHKDIQIQLILENGNCDGLSATSATQKLINVDKVPIILGGSCSSETLAAGKIANKNHTVLFSSFASAPAISNIGPYVFRFWNDAYAVQFLTDFVSKHNHTVALLYEKTDYAEAMANEFIKEFRGDIKKTYTFQSNEKDFNILAKQIQKIGSSIDGIVFFTQDEVHAVDIINSMNRYGLLHKFKDNIYSAYWFNTPLFLSKVGDLAEGLIEVNVEYDINHNKKTKDFLEDFSKKYGIKSLDIGVVSEQEGISIILDCIEKGSRNAEDFKKCLTKINSNNKRSGYFNNSYYFNTSGDAVGNFDFILEKLEKGKIETIG